jgi:formylmethanofuran dehydrogenase subunit E
MRYKIGDELVLKVEDTFGHNDRIYRRVKVQVIGYNTDNDSDETEYLVYVPPYEFLKNTFKLTDRHARWYNVDAKFIDDDVAFINARHPIYQHLPAPEGERCDHCNEFFEGAVRDADGAYMCRACKFDPWR